MLDGGDHQILRILALDRLCGGDIAQRLTGTYANYLRLLKVLTYSFSVAYRFLFRRWPDL